MTKYKNMPSKMDVKFIQFTLQISFLLQLEKNLLLKLE